MQLKKFNSWKKKILSTKVEEKENFLSDEHYTRAHTSGNPLKRLQRQK